MVNKVKIKITRFNDTSNQKTHHDLLISSLLLMYLIDLNDVRSSTQSSSGTFLEREVPQQQKLNAKAQLISS